MPSKLNPLKCFVKISICKPFHLCESFSVNLTAACYLCKAVCTGEERRFEETVGRGQWKTIGL